MRKPISIDEQEYLNELFQEYKEKRETQYEMQADCKELNTSILKIFKKYDIREKNWEDKIIKIKKITKYKYPASLIYYWKKHPKTKIIEVEYLMMVNNKNADLDNGEEIQAFNPTNLDKDNSTVFYYKNPLA